MLFAASRDTDPERRWGLLWVLLPALTRVARGPVGHRAVMSALAADPIALQLLLRQAQADRGAFVRFFERARVDLLELLIARLAQHHADPRRRQAVASLVGVVERRSSIVLPLLEPLESEVRAACLAALSLREDDPRLSAARLGGRLRSPTSSSRRGCRTS